MEKPHTDSTKKPIKTVNTVHNHEPDYTNPSVKIPSEAYERMYKRLRILYGEDIAKSYMPEMERIIKVFFAHKPPALIEMEKKFDTTERFTEKDVILITYGDLLQGQEDTPLATLGKFCDIYLEGAINTLHILPFFPYSSDRGFSIIDFETVDPNLGTWEDIRDLESRYQLMFDGVINHISAKSRWFQEFINGNTYYGDFFITYSSPDELSEEERNKIFRPRTSDILTEFHTINGPKYVWTTFSNDQIDLNYKNPNVLMRVLEILLMYVRQGADIIRLDAITYLWAEPGTRCVHLEETHEIVKLFRDILDTFAPTTSLITETNVPHNENISYFGNGRDEAQMVYNFALPPLVLHTFYTEDTTAITQWAQKLENISNTTTFFNFLDSHDGIGLMGVKGILTKEEINYVVERAREHGGLISYKTGNNGTNEPYEINITWFSALNGEDDEEDDIAFQVKRFVASRIMGLILQGVPGIYLHSLIGSSNDIKAVLSSKSKRAINRTIIDGSAINKALQEPFSKISRINREFGRLISIRTKERAFHPNGAQHIFEISPKIFTVLRISPEEDEQILCLINVSNDFHSIEIPLSKLNTEETNWNDLVSDMAWMADDNKLFLKLDPYDVSWLKAKR